MFRLAHKVSSLGAVHRVYGFQALCQSRYASSPSVAVVLSGCGVYDGTEIHEASAVMVHLSRSGADITAFAPDINQMHVINHAVGQPIQETRQVLKESARISRGDIEKLSELKSKNFDAVIFPGGFGAAKNLCNFAVEGEKCRVDDDVEMVIRDFHSASKPIGMCCIAPVVAARVLGKLHSIEVTVGQDQNHGDSKKWPYTNTVPGIINMGAKHMNKNVDEVHIDARHKIVTTPAFMCDAQYHEVFDGIGKMIEEVLKLLKK